MKKKIIIKSFYLFLGISIGILLPYLITPNDSLPNWWKFVFGFSIIATMALHGYIEINKD